MIATRKISTSSLVLQCAVLAAFLVFLAPPRPIDAQAPRGAAPSAVSSPAAGNAANPATANQPTPVPVTDGTGTPATIGTGGTGSAGGTSGLTLRWHGGSRQLPRARNGAAGTKGGTAAPGKRAPAAGESPAVFVGRAEPAYTGNWLVLKDGSKLKMKGEPSVQGNVVVFHDPADHLLSMRAETVDLEATRRANHKPAPATARRPRGREELSLASRSLATAAPTDEINEEDEDGAAPSIEIHRHRRAGRPATKTAPPSALPARPARPFGPVVPRGPSGPRPADPPLPVVV